jgi:hypothetical protein
MGGKSNSFGRFGYRALVGTFERDMRSFQPESVPFGLGLPTQWIYGFFQDADGRLYMPVRKFTAALSGGLFLNAESGGALAVDPASGRSSRGELHRTFGDDHVTWDDPMWHRMPEGTIPADEQPVSLRVSNRELTYSEGDIMELSGPSAGLGIQFYVSAPDAPLFFTSLCYWVTGTINGRPVEGPAYFDALHGKHGREWKEYTYFSDLELSWNVFTNKYDDDSVEWGHLIAGRSDFGLAVIVSGDRTQALQSTFNASYELDESGFSHSQQFELNGEKYEFTSEPSHWMTEYSASRSRPGNAFRAQLGQVRRVGDTRELVRGISWLESFPNRIRQSLSSQAGD